MIVLSLSSSNRHTSPHRPDDNTIIKAKCTSDAVCSGSLKQRVNSFLKFIVCAEVDTKEMGADGHKFGFGLEFE
jgi:hypothetical protein